MRVSPDVHLASGALPKVNARCIGHHAPCLFIQVKRTRNRHRYRAPSHPETHNMQETRKTAEPAHTLHNLPAQPISEEVLIEKYAKGEERSIAAVHARVARALAQAEPPEQRRQWE